MNTKASIETKMNDAAKMRMGTRRAEKTELRSAAVRVTKTGDATKKNVRAAAAMTMKVRIAIATVLLTVSACFLPSGTDSRPPTVASIVSLDIAPYEAALEGLKSVYRGVLIEFRIGHSKKKAALAIERVKAMSPVAVVVVGSDALKAVRTEITDIPLVFLMTLDPRLEAERDSNMAGIGLDVPLEEQLSLLKRVAPEVARIGVVYDPTNTHALVSSLSTAARAKGVELEALPVGTAAEALEALRGLADRVDAFMMVPDVTTATDKCFGLMLLLSFMRKIPLLALSPKYVADGALIAPAVDYRDVGEQAGGVLVEIINGEKPEELGYMRPRKVSFALNTGTAKRIGIELSPSLVEQAAVVYE